MTEKKFLTEKEMELLETIRNSENPQMALYKAIGIIAEVTKKPDTAYYEANNF